MARQTLPGWCNHSLTHVQLLAPIEKQITVPKSRHILRK